MARGSWKEERAKKEGMRKEGVIDLCGSIFWITSFLGELYYSDNYRNVAFSFPLISSVIYCFFFQEALHSTNESVC